MSIEKYGVIQTTKFDNQNDIHLENLNRNGYTIVDSGLTEQEIHHLHENVSKLKRDYAEKFRSVVVLDEIDEQNTVRAPFLFDSIYLEVCFNKNLINIVKQVLQNNFILNQQNIIINPGQKSYNQALWHRDLPYQHFTISSPLAINALFCIDDFTLENGSTSVLPGSHKVSEFPSDHYVKRNALQILAKKGQYIVIDSMLYHKGGYNSTSSDRMAINNVFSSPIIRRQIEINETSFFYSLDSLSEKYFSLLGLNYKTVSSVDAYLRSRIR